MVTVTPVAGQPAIEKFVIEVSPDVASALQGILHLIPPGASGNETVDRWEGLTRSLFARLLEARDFKGEFPPENGRLLFARG